MNEQDKSANDALVSATYRELADERTPPHLDQRILDMAADAAGSRPRRGLLSGWMQPMAWAATIGLTVAIVIEINQIDEIRSDLERLESSVPADVMSEDRAATEPDPRSELQREIAAAPAASETQASKAMSLGNAAPEKSEQINRQRDQLNESIAIEEMKLRKSPSAPAARSVQSSSDEARATIFADDAEALTALPEAEDETVCSDEVQRFAEQWRQCIQRLRGSGAEAAADREYRAYVDKFGPVSPLSEQNK